MGLRGDHEWQEEMRRLEEHEWDWLDDWSDDFFDNGPSALLSLPHSLVAAAVATFADPDNIGTAALTIRCVCLIGWWRIVLLLGTLGYLLIMVAVLDSLLGFGIFPR